MALRLNQHWRQYEKQEEEGYGHQFCLWAITTLY